MGRQVHGHDEHPWNKFADVVAKHSCRKHVRFGFGARLIQPWTLVHVDEWQWAWLFQRQFEGHGLAFLAILER